MKSGNDTSLFQLSVGSWMVAERSLVDEADDAGNRRGPEQTR